MTFRTAAGLSIALAALAFSAGPEPAPKYDRATEVDVAAVVLTAKELPKENPLSGITLMVKTESDATMGVYLGPTEFLKPFEITFSEGITSTFSVPR